MIGHPTGRLLGRRDPYPVNIERIIRVAAETGTCLEINASPERLDLKRHARRSAKDAGVLLTVNTDAHRIEGLQQISYGITVARRAWLEAGHVLDSLPLDELRRTLKRSKV